MAKPDFKFTLKKFGAAFAWDVEVTRKPTYVESEKTYYEFVFNNRSHKIFGLTDHLLVTHQNRLPSLPQEFNNVKDVANQYLNNFYMEKEEESKTAQRSLLFRGERFA